MKIHESAEMYLETIYKLSRSQAVVRSIDIAEAMGYSKPSISRAVSLLKQGGYLLMDKDGTLNLTETGLELAKKIYERHMVISRALMALGVDEATAIDDACRIEHVISDESFYAIKEHLRVMKRK